MYGGHVIGRKMKAWCDGYCKPNPEGIATYGYVIRSDDVSKVISEDYGFVGKGEGYRSNVAEFEALYRLLEDLVCNIDEYGTAEIEIYSDCKPMVHSLNHNNIFSDVSVEKNRQAQEYLDMLNAELQWVRGGLNGEADKLSRRAYAVQELKQRV